MALQFKKIFVACILICALQPIIAQVSINVSVKPPFTPFISDYTNPARLQDISLSLFNQSGNDLRLKFKLTLVNQAKGIRIAIKEFATPVAPLELQKNEFKFVVLEDVSNLYGKLDQNSFDIAGADIQNLILDGTIPDGIYELCLQAFDFDAPGFSKPLSGTSPSGCFTFQVNYTDPPTDIRLNNNVLMYNFGGIVPKIGVNSALGQNYTVQFTPPAMNIGSQYEYELMVFSEDVINPSMQRENSLLQAIETIMPLINKTSSVPFFIIDQSDLQLDFNKNYFLLIKAIDINEKTLFKNKGFSTFKAFNLVDIQPLFIGPPEIKNNVCGMEIEMKELPSLITLDNGFDVFTNIRIKDIVETRVKFVRYDKLVISPTDIFNSNTGQILLDTVFTYNNSTSIAQFIAIPARFKKPEDNLQKKWVIGVQHRLKEHTPFTSFLNFSNNGKTQCEFTIMPAESVQFKDLLLTVTYPLNNDTIPFQYPPIVIKTDNLNANNKIVLTQFNSGLEIIESNKYLKLSTDPNFNTLLNNIALDTTLSLVRNILNKAARLQLEDGNSILIDDYIRQAISHINTTSAKSKIDVNYALNCRNLPLGSSSNSKLAILQRILQFEAGKQLLSSNDMVSIPNLKNILYTSAYKNNILWTSRIGIYSDNFFYNQGMTLEQFEYKFSQNSFTSDEMGLEMLKQGLKTTSGNFNVGMRTPQLQSPYNGRELRSGVVNFSFLTSPKPQKLFPNTDNNDVWKEYEYLSVSQQWNFELSTDKEFKTTDTVISRRIVKNYNIRGSEAEITEDLYKDVKLSLNLQKEGKYYWRVTWSNVTVDQNSSEAEKAYFLQLGNLLAASQLLGEDVSIDSTFFIRQNYRISAVDSFIISNKDNSIATVPALRYELLYPLNNDTIPFMYPPVVIRSNSPDTSYKFVLSKFNSNLEPFENHNYYLIDTLNNATKTLQRLSYDSTHRRLVRSFDALAKEQLLGNYNGDGIQESVNTFLAQTEKKTHLQFFKTPGSELLILGNSPTGKINLSQLIAGRNAAIQVSGDENIQPNTPNFGQLVYFKPYKNVVWTSKFAYFTPYNEYTPVDSFESQFNKGLLSNNSSISGNNKQGLADINGNFTVGMKTPELQALSGKSVSNKNIKLRFKPSAAPHKIFPITDNNEAWQQWQNLMVAQQWNIEVSKSPTFDSLVFVRSKCIIETYSMPGSQERLMNDLYNMREEVITLDTTGKFYYRITWSNPTNIDTSNDLHRDFYALQSNLEAANQSMDGVESNISDMRSFLSLERKNYRFSIVDSFFAVDSSAKNDTAVCGLNCTFSMNGVNTTPQTGHISVSDIVKVGQFDMKINTIIFNPTNKTAQGTGSIRCNLFPAPIAVVFSDVKFNAEKRMVVGTVKAKTKTADVLNDYVSNNRSLFDGILTKYIDYSRVKNELNQGVSEISEGQIEDLYSFLNSPLCLALSGITGEEISMPFGLSKEVDNFPHTIAITDIVFTPSDAKFNAAAILSFPLGASNQFLGFGASDICLTPKGLGLTSNGGALELMGSLDIMLGDFQKLRILGRQGDSAGNSGSSGTRMAWDCKGFKHIDLKVSLEMSRNLMVPMNGKKTAEGKVTATGHTVISSLNNWMLSINFDKNFQLKSLPGFIFTCRQATLDISDIANAQGMVFPLNYLGEKTTNWKGLYIQEIGLRLPDAFSERDTTLGININARNILIDHAGITAKIGIENILSLDNGSMAGWKYSIDSFAIDIVNNVPRNTKLSGRLTVPILNGQFRYGMLLHPSSNGDSLFAHFSLNNTNEVEMPAWFASLNITTGSKIEVLGDITRPHTMSLQSNLNGNISLGGDDIGGLKDVRLGTLPFEGLKVKTSFADAINFDISLDKLGGMSMNRMITENQLPDAPAPTTNTTPATQSSGEQKTGGFPINISDIGIDKFSGKCTFDLNEEPGTRIGVTFKITVNIADLGGNSIGGSCNLGIYATPKAFDNIWEFHPSGLNVDTIKIAADLNGAVKVAGGIAFMANDPVYGNGVAGFLMANIQPGISVGVSGMFGEINGMRYWMFGAFAKIPPIPIDFSANVLYANSISAEVWYKMRRTSGDATSQAGGFQIGRSPSGASFLPDQGTLFGFGAALGLTGPPGSPLFGDVGLYASINDHGGLSSLTMEGNIWMTNDDKTTAPVLVNCNATIDIDNEKFTANLTALVNVAGGIVRGRTVITDNQGKTFYQAGSGSLLIDVRNNNWHIKLGDPFVTNGRLGFGFYAGSAELFNAGGYFMMGNNLPQRLPPMNTQLINKLTAAGITIPAHRESTRTGFAIQMGIDASIPEQKIEMGFFYAGLSFQFAVDGMLAPSTFTCQNRDGIKNWYLTGKAYAVVNGALGMHIDMPFYKGDIIAMELNAGMMLDAGLPNPYYFKGTFSANYSVLGGLIEGNKQVNFELAEDLRCKPNISANNVSFSAIVADSKPIGGSTNVSVGAEPVIALNFALDKEIKIYVPRVGVSSPPEEVKFRVRKEYIRLLESNSKNRKVNVLLSTDGLTLTIRPDSFLKPGYTQYKLSAKFYVEKYNRSRNIWEKVIRTGNRPWDTLITILFSTEQFAMITESNISYSTPLAGENFYKKGDFSTGKIVFKQNNAVNTFFTGTLRTSSPFRDVDLINGYNVYYGQFAVAGYPNDTQRVVLRYYNNEVHFTVPSTLTNGKLYQFRIIREKVPGMSLQRTNSITYNGSSNTFQMRTIKAAEIADRRVIIYSFNFKVSKYNTITDKISQLYLKNSMHGFTANDTINVVATTAEPFELFEVNSYTYPLPSGSFTTSPLVVSCSNNAVDDNAWMNSFYRPKVVKAGDSLQRKKSSLTTAFYDRTKQLTGARIAFNDHIFKPLPSSSLIFTFDFRLAEIKLTNVQLAVQNLEISKLSGVNMTINMSNTGLTLDPQTNSLSSGSYLNSSTQITSSNSTPIPLGSEIHIRYFHYMLMNQDFNRLKSLANNIVNTNVMYWQSGLTSSEISLVNRVRLNSYIFQIPYNNNKFAIAFHRNSFNNSPSQKLFINSSLMELINVIIVTPPPTTTTPVTTITTIPKTTTTITTTKTSFPKTTTFSTYGK